MWISTIVTNSNAGIGKGVAHNGKLSFLVRLFCLDNALFPGVIVLMFEAATVYQKELFHETILTSSRYFCPVVAGISCFTGRAVVQSS